MNNKQKKSSWLRELLIATTAAVVGGVLLFLILPNDKLPSQKKSIASVVDTLKINPISPMGKGPVAEDISIVDSPVVDLEVIDEVYSSTTPPPPKPPNKPSVIQSLPIRVPSNHTNAKIYVNGDWVSNAPNVIKLPTGRHKIEVVGDSLLYEEMITVPTGRRTFINISENENKYQ